MRCLPATLKSSGWQVTCLTLLITIMNATFTQDMNVRQEVQWVPGGWRQVWQNARRMCATGSWKALEWLCRLPKDEAKSDDLAIWSYIDRPMHVSEVFGIPPPLCLTSSNFQESEHCVLLNDKLLMSELRVHLVCWAKNLTSFTKLQAQLC